MKNPLIYKYNWKKSAKFIEPLWLIGRASAFYQKGRVFKSGKTITLKLGLSLLSDENAGGLELAGYLEK
jgi:hypothetical protein